MGAHLGTSWKSDWWADWLPRWIKTLSGSGNAYVRFPLPSCFISSVSLAVFYTKYWYYGFPSWHSRKEPTCQCRRCWFDPWVGKIFWRRKWQSTPVFLPGEFLWQRNLEGYSLWGHRVRHDWATNTYTFTLYLKSSFFFMVRKSISREWEWMWEAI